MSNGKGPKAHVSRRDTLKLATAVSALGVGLGVVLTGKNAVAATIKLEGSAVGTLAIKYYRGNKDKGWDLLHAADLSPLLVRNEANTLSIKLYNLKQESQTVIAQHDLTITQFK